MFNVGASEAIFILVAALLLLGPKRLPEMARGLGKFLREFRRQTDEVRTVVEREFYRMDEEINAPLPSSRATPSRSFPVNDPAAQSAQPAGAELGEGEFPPSPTANSVHPPSILPPEGTPVPSEARRSGQTSEPEAASSAEPPTSAPSKP